MKCATFCFFGEPASMPPDENDRLDEIWRDDLFEREPDPSFLIDFLVAKIGERKERSLQLTLSELIGLGPITFLFTIPLARFIAVDRKLAKLRGRQSVARLQSWQRTP